MPLPKRLEGLISKVNPQTEIERDLLDLLSKRLVNSLSALRKGLDGSGECYEKALKCALNERSAACLDRYEACVEQCIATSLRRNLTEREEELIGELVGEIVSITEVLLTIGGVDLADAPEEKDEDEDGR